jgi:hypothetical protein
MWILKQTCHPHPLIIQPHTVLVPLLLLVLLSLGVLSSSLIVSKSSSNPAASTSSSRLKLSSS